MFLALACAGCSDLTAKVAGVVYLDGEPLGVTDSQRGMVVFRPVAGGATCSGLIDERGSYSISTGSSSALVPGDYLVSVRVMELIEPENENDAPAGRPITPAVYGDPLTSGLTVMVQRGANTFDVQLKSSAGPPVIEPVSPKAEAEESDADGAPVADDASSVEVNDTAADELPEGDAAEAAAEEQDTEPGNGSTESPEKVKPEGVGDGAE